MLKEYKKKKKEEKHVSILLFWSRPSVRKSWYSNLSRNVATHFHAKACNRHWNGILVFHFSPVCVPRLRTLTLTVTVSLALRTVSPPCVSTVLYRLSFTSIGEVSVVKHYGEMPVHCVCNTPFGMIYG